MKRIIPNLLTKAQSEILHGIHPIKLALEAGKRNVFKLYIKQGLMAKPRDSIIQILQLANTKKIFVSLSSSKELDRISNYSAHQGVCMEVSKKEFLEHDWKKFKNPPNKKDIQILVALESIYDPMNFGSILRTCNYLGFDKLIVSKKNCCRLSPIVSKASSGAMEMFDIEAVDDMPQLLQNYKERDWSIVGTSHNSSISLNNYLPHTNTIVVFGNEGNGLTEETLQICDHVISIHSPGNHDKHVNCLNVNVATGIVLHYISTCLKKPQEITRNLPEY